MLFTYSRGSAPNLGVQQANYCALHSVRCGWHHKLAAVIHCPWNSQLHCFTWHFATSLPLLHTVSKRYWRIWTKFCEM